MKKTRQQMLNFQAQLEHLGKRLETFSKINFNNNRIQELGVEFSSTFKDLDAQQVCNRYEWKGLPDYLTGHLIEQMLYYKGALCGFFHGGALYVLPFTQTKGLNVYGAPNSIQPITFNGELNGSFAKFGKELPVNSLGKFNENAGAAILFDRIPTFSQNDGPIGRAFLNDELIRYQCDLLGRVKNNLRNIDKKVVFWVDNEAQKNQMANDIREAYGTSDPFIIAVKGVQLSDKEKSQTLQGDIANEIQSLFETWQSVNSIRCMCSGITNGGAFEKKERKIMGELQGDQTQTELVLDAGLKMRKLWLDQMKAIYPQYIDILSKISIEINKNANENELEYVDNNFQKGGVNENE